MFGFFSALTLLLSIPSFVLAQDDDANATVSTQYRCSVAAKGEIFNPFEEAGRFVTESNGMRVLDLSEGEANAVRELVTNKAGCTTEEKGNFADVTGPFFARAVILPVEEGVPDENGEIIIRFDTPVEIQAEDET